MDHERDGLVEGEVRTAMKGWPAIVNSTVSTSPFLPDGKSAGARTILPTDCADQTGVDRLWDALPAVPEAEQCGWCKDRYGLSWQIVPDVVPCRMVGIFTFAPEGPGTRYRACARHWDEAAMKPARSDGLRQRLGTGCGSEIAESMARGA